jgi:hypothetical protein
VDIHPIEKWREIYKEFADLIVEVDIVDYGR